MEYDLTDHKAKVIKNTFLPNCRSKYLSVNALVSFLRNGFAQNDDIPKEISQYIFDVIEGKNPKWEDYK